MGNAFVNSFANKFMLLKSFGTIDKFKIVLSLLLFVDKLWKFIDKEFLETNSIVFDISDIFIPIIEIDIVFWLLNL